MNKRLKLLARVEDKLMSIDGFRIGELRRELDCSDKTIRRALKLLRSVGAKPIESKTHDGWKWRYPMGGCGTLFTNDAREKLLGWDDSK